MKDRWKVPAILIGVTFFIAVIYLFAVQKDKMMNIKVWNNGSDTQIVPRIYELSWNYAGGYGDSWIDHLPGVQASSGDEVVISFDAGLPTEATLFKYDVMKTDNCLGAAGVLENMEELEVKRYEDKISFVVPEFWSKHQLIRCSYEWRFLFLRTKFYFVFSLEAKS